MSERLARVIRVQAPISGNVDTTVRRAVERAIVELRAAANSPAGDARAGDAAAGPEPAPRKQSAERPVLVLEFVPRDGDGGEGSNFGRAYDLAQFLAGQDLSGFRTVAYLPRGIRGHAVLVALACEELIMAPDAELGSAGVDEARQRGIDPTHRAAYRQIASERRTVPPEVALGMLDKDLEVLKVDTEVSTEYVLRQDLDALCAKHQIRSETVIKRPGELGRFSGREGRELGFVRYLAADRSALAKSLDVPASALEEDPSLGGEWRPVLVVLRGPLTGQQTSRVQRTIEEKIRDENVNFVCLRIESEGGAMADSMTLANYIAGLDRGQIRTVAYVPTQALADAALVAVACDELVMQKDALLGGAGPEMVGADEMRLVREGVRENLAKKKERPWSIPVALVDPGLSVFRYVNVDSGRTAYFSPEEAEEQPDRKQWNRAEEITVNGTALQLDGARAEVLGVARHVVKDFDQLREIYGLDGDITQAEPSWADYLIDALASPAVAYLLLLIGGAAFLVELQAPGIGVGGFVAGVCFLLYFWSQHLHGTAGWLEALLFLAGVCCLLLEVFVLPGVGVFGLGGGMLIIVSLVLASQTFIIPHNEYQLTQLRDSLLGLSAVGAGVVVSALLMRRYLPRSPIFKHIMLEAPSGEELADLDARESLVDFSHLIGQQGVAVTPLMPSGKARFGQQVVDVISAGGAMSRGDSLLAHEVHGNRVLVRPAETSPKMES